MRAWRPAVRLTIGRIEASSLPMEKDQLNVAIVGAGMGGLAAAAALRKVDLAVTVYEQARQFTRLGAGIQIGCNAMHVLRGLGLELLLRAETFYPRSWNNRHWKTGEVLFDMLFGPSAETKYGAPYLLAHRGDLHEALASIVPPDCLRLDHRLTGVEQSENGVRLSFANGGTAAADLLIGADGVNSIVRAALFDESEPRFAGRIAYRTVFPARLLDGFDIGDCTKWWGEDRHIVMYPVKPDRSEVYFVTSQPEPDFGLEFMVGKGRRESPARGVRGLPSGRSEGAGRLSRCPQAGAGRSRAARALDRRQGRVAGRRLPSDDALHGAGCGDGDRGCGDPVALPGGRRSRRHRRCARDL